MTKKEKTRFVSAIILSLFSISFATLFLQIGVASIGFEITGAENGFSFAAQIVLSFGLLFVQFFGIAVASGLLLGAFLSHSFKKHENRSVKLTSFILLFADVAFAVAIIVVNVLMIRF